MNADKNPSTTSAIESLVEELPPDAAYRILASGQRRRLLDELADTEPPVSLGELSERIRARSDSQTAPGDQIAVRLHHIHLPLLDSEDLVEYDAAAKRVTAVALPARSARD